MPTRTISWSEIDCFRQCPFKHELTYKQRWTKPAEEGTALYRGTLFHSVMENHYNRLKILKAPGLTDEEKVDQSAQYLANIWDLLSLGDLDAQSEEQSLVKWMLDGYCEKWDFDDEWEILEVEHADEFWLPTDKGTRSTFKIKMKIDLLVKHKATGKVWIVDHKSGKELPTDKMLELNDQFALYVWGKRQRGLDVQGAIHNACRSFRYKDQSKPYPLDTRFKRTMLYRTDAELQTVAIEAYKTMRRAYAIKPGEAERSPNEDTCRWRCNFTEDCLGSRKQPLDKQAVYINRSLKLHGFEQNFTRH